jgi:hypothetical protein
LPPTPWFSEVAWRHGLISVRCYLLASVIAAAVDRMGCWSACPAARQSRLLRAGVVALGHVTALDPPCGPYPRREVSAAAAGSVREAGPNRRAHPLLLQSRAPAAWGLRRQPYLLRRRHLPSRAAAYRELPQPPLAWRSWRLTYQPSAARSVRTVTRPADGQQPTVLRAPLSPVLLPPADRPISPAAV